MDPVLQWILGVVAALGVGGILAAAKGIFGLKDEVAQVKADVRVMRAEVSATLAAGEKRFEELEQRQQRHTERIRALEVRLK